MRILCMAKRFGLDGAAAETETAADTVRITYTELPLADADFGAGDAVAAVIDGETAVIFGGGDKVYSGAWKEQKDKRIRQPR